MGFGEFRGEVLGGFGGFWGVLGECIRGITRNWGGGGGLCTRCPRPDPIDGREFQDGILGIKSNPKKCIGKRVRRIPKYTKCR